MNDDTFGNDRIDETARTHRLQHDGTGSITTTVALAIADLDGVDPAEMEPLHGAVDPALLEKVVEDDRQVSADVMFAYRGYRVTVDSDGTIVISPKATCPE